MPPESDLMTIDRGFDPYPLQEAAFAGGDPGPQFFLNADQRDGPTDNGKVSFTIDQAANQIIRGEPGWSGALGVGFTVTITGGSGADIFHTFSGAGIDKVLDFHLAQGDRVMLDPGTAFTVIQVGSDTVIDMGNGDQMILVGVQMSTLTGSWIFGA